MAYIGRQNLGGAYRQLDDISSGFDGSDTTHTMQVNSQNVTVGDVNQIILSLGGVIQKPGTDFTVSGSVLTFTTAPAANTSFFAILLGSDNGGTVTPTDASVTASKLASDIAITTTGASNFNNNVTISVADNTDTLTLTSTDADATSGPILKLNRNSSSPADSDDIGKILFTGENDASESIDYATIRGDLLDVTDGTEDGIIKVEAITAGTNKEMARFGNGVGVVFNEDSNSDLDFRVESDGLTHALFVDAGNDIVRVGQSSGGDSANSVLQVGGSTHNVYAAHVYHSANPSSAAPYGVQITYTNGSPDADSNTANLFIRCNDTTTDRFKVAGDGDVLNHDNSYGQISDERLKTNIVDANSQWDDIKALKVRNFEKKDDIELHGAGKRVQIGVIAQELEAAGMNGLVKTGEPSDFDIKYGVPSDDKVKSVKYSVLYMKAIKALQEAMAKIETLEADVKTLKGE